MRVAILSTRSELKFDTITGVISPAKFIPSPNFNERPFQAKIDMIVIHNISLPPGEFQKDYVSLFFTNQLPPHAHPYFETIYERKVSSHFYIRRDGQLIQYVPVYQRAWHAGQSSFLGQDNCNDFSIGIELEGVDDLAYEPIQYELLVSLVKNLQLHFPDITNKRIVGHEHIAPGRKTDPGPAFSWDYFFQLLDETQ